MNKTAYLFSVLITLLLVYSCKQHVQLNKLNGKLVTIDSTLNPDSMTNSEITPYKTGIDKLMNRVIGVNEAQLLSYAPESPLSNLVSDIIKDKALTFLKENNTDSLPLFSLMNIKGLRTPLAKGNITVRNIFELMPFENEITILTLPGDSIYALFEFICKTNGEGISGARVTYADNKITSLTINGKLFNKSKNYFLATSDYLANGGDYFNMITAPTQRKDIGSKIRESIIEHIENLSQNNQSVVAKIEGRITLD